MKKEEWIRLRTMHLVRAEGIAEERAPLLAKAQADAHERVKGPIGPKWPAPDHFTVFNTRGEDDE